MVGAAAVRGAAALGAITPVAAEEAQEAATTAVAAAERALRDTPAANILATAAAVAEARPTLSLARRTFTCGKGGKIRPLTGWSS